MSKVFILVGISGSGKSTWAVDRVNKTQAVWVSTDNIREALFGDATIQAQGDRVFEMAREQLESALRNNIEEVIVDATNVDAKSRAQFIKLSKNYNAHVVAVCFDVPLKTAQLRNGSRTRVVPSFVIERQFNKLNFPIVSEGVDEIIWIQN